MSADARWREADEEAADAVRDVYDDGEPVLLRYDGSYVPEGGRAPVVVAPVDITTHAVFEEFSEAELAAGGIRATDARVLIAHGRRDAVPVKHAGQSLVGLGALQDEMAGLPIGRAPKAGGFAIYQHEEALGRTDYPAVGGANVRKWDVITRLSEARDAGVPVIHRLQARG